MKPKRFLHGHVTFVFLGLVPTAYSLLFLAILKSSSLGLYVNRSFVLYLSRDHLNYFRCTEVRAYVDTTKFQPSTILSTNEITFDWSAVLWLVKRSEYGQNLLLPSYTRTVVHCTLVHSYRRTLVPSYTCTVVHSYRRTLVSSYTRTVVHSCRRTLVPSYRRTLVRRRYGRTLKGLGFKQIDNVFKGGTCLLKHLG